MMEILEQRAKNYAVADEIRFSKYDKYVASVNALTNDAYLKDLRLHVKRRGFETQTQFANPVFQNNQRWVLENKRLNQLISQSTFDLALRNRNQARSKFNRSFPNKFSAVQKAKSKLTSATTAALVAKELKKIKQTASLIRQLQAEAHRLRFFEKEFDLVSKDVQTKRAEVLSLENELAQLSRYSQGRRLRVNNVKKGFVSRIRMATQEIADAQKSKC